MHHFLRHAVFVSRQEFITEFNATVIDNILVNEVNGNSPILVTDISDHLPTVFVGKQGLKVKYNNSKLFHMYKRHTVNESANF